MYNKEKIYNVLRDIREVSKEISPYVVIAQPRRIKEEIPAQNFDGILMHVDLMGYSRGFVNIYGESVDVARNYLIDRVLESDAKYMFFIGEDTVVPYDGFKHLHKTAEENPGSVVAGVYYIKTSAPMISIRKGNHITIPNVDPGQVFEAWQTGMDCMLIPVEILRKIRESDPEIPFCCIANNIEDIPFIGEDNFFVHRLRQHGIKLLVNTDVQCLHMDLADGKYTAHQSVNLDHYYVNEGIKITQPHNLLDKRYLDKRWFDRLPGNNKTDDGSLNQMVDVVTQQNLPVKINFGSGWEKMEGYIAVDKYDNTADIQADVFEVTLPDESVDEIYSSHLIEHLPHQQIPGLIGKWYRNLKTGGKLILETPDLEKMCEAFANASDQQRYELSLCIFGAVANNEKFPHLWGYYPAILSEIVAQAGFKDISILPNVNQHPGINFRLEAIK